jgi:hypothetical protein
MPRRNPGESFPPTDGDVYVKGVNFDKSGNAAGAFRGKNGCPAAAEGVKDDAVSPTAIAY